MKTLLLDAVYRPIAFVGSDRKIIKYLVKDKIETISNWNNQYLYGNVGYPSIIRLKDYIRKKVFVPAFSYKNIFIRDENTCQYTGKKLSNKELTIDHVVPKSRGGKSTWDNCVTALPEINSFKGNKLLHEIPELKLIREPKSPSNPLYCEYISIYNKHKDWENYFSNG